MQFSIKPNTQQYNHYNIINSKTYFGILKNIFKTFLVFKSNKKYLLIKKRFYPVNLYQL